MAEEEISEIDAKTSALEKFTTESNKMLSFIEDYITGEKYIDELSKLLIYAGKEKADSILSKIDSATTEKIKARLTEIALNGESMRKDSPKVLATVGAVMRKQGFFGLHTSDELMQIFTSAEQKEFAENTDEFFQINPLLTMNAEQNLFSFEDIVMLDDRAIQKVLREVDTQELSKALKNVDAEVQDKIYRNMSKRAAGMLKEDMEFMGPVRLKDIDEAQAKIVKIIRSLEKDGEIVIARNKDDEMIV